MRLEKIRLSGFKSFVDVTTLRFPANLAGVVGPNGCGKSNLIDAVRWVMGESSARQLRGEAMSDVIFNGSATRKPVGLASVELLFDNSAGLAPGAYRDFAEIAIKRQITRDGQSQYFLNGGRCRRRDVTELFLGTGLGPRSYAIIEQGTISRLVEARPEDLRGFVEEAAGVSRYRERRHETEQRLDHTRENLGRLDDLAGEIRKQIQSLERQAQKAERHITLSREALTLQREGLALRWRVLDGKRAAQDTAVQAREDELRRLADETAVLARDLREQQEAQSTLRNLLHDEQATHYELAARLAQHEQRINHARQNRSDWTAALAQLDSEHADATHQLAHDLDSQNRLETEYRALDAILDAAGAQESAAIQAAARERKAHNEDLQAFESLRASAGLAMERVTAARTALHRLTDERTRLGQRGQSLAEEEARLHAQRDDDAAIELTARLAALENTHALAQSTLNAHLNALPGLRLDLQENQERLLALQGEQQKFSALIASLERLQQHAMGKDRPAINDWLHEIGLDGAARLAEHLDTTPGWETAVERLLGARLDALCVNEFPTRLTPPVDATLNLLLTQTTDAAEPGPDALLAQVRAPWSLTPLLGGVRCAASLDEALARRAQLAPGESLVTPQGDWLSTEWLVVCREDAGHTGVLLREKELRVLRQAHEDAVERIATATTAVQQAESAVRLAEQRRDAAQETLRDGHGALRETVAELSTQRARAQEIVRRGERIAQERQSLAEEETRIAQEVATAADGLATLDAELERQQRALPGHEARTQSARARLEDAERAAHTAQNARHAAREALATVHSRLDLTGQHIDRLRQRTAQTAQRHAALKAQIAGLDEPMAKDASELEHLRTEHAQREDVLRQQRAEASARETHLRHAAEAHERAERALSTVRDGLETARLERQEVRTRCQSARERLAELDANPEDVLATLPGDAEESLWSERLASVRDRLNKLGPVNLGAPEELGEQTGRLDALDRQREDLATSLATLEDAIRKIDRECRARILDTLTKINTGLENTFPKLFGGGTARLEFCGDDPLTAGVTLMARPPGKRNSSIHLLSGGEKALTAIALVFAIFALNPSPFCLLDEVDAPLDEANVSRFGELVREMAETVQFVLITHNKTTMESLDHLVGVTMKEPGVSRIVAVDVAQAVELATS